MNIIDVYVSVDKNTMVFAREAPQHVLTHVSCDVWSVGMNAAGTRIVLSVKLDGNKSEDVIHIRAAVCVSRAAVAVW